MAKKLLCTTRAPSSAPPSPHHAMMSAIIASSLFLLGTTATRVKIDPFSAINTCIGHCQAQGPYTFRSQTGAIIGGGGVTLKLKLSDDNTYAYEIRPPEVADSVDVITKNNELILNAAKNLEKVSISISLHIPINAVLAR